MAFIFRILDEKSEQKKNYFYLFPYVPYMLLLVPICESLNDDRLTN